MKSGSGAPSEAVAKRAARRRSGLQSGWAPARQATAPATRGVESEVPLAVAKLLLSSYQIVAVCRPRASTSGLSRPSAGGATGADPGGSAGAVAGPHAVDPQG